MGDAKAKREIAAKMKSMGLSPEQIAQATDLSIEAGSVSSSVSGAGPSDSLDMQI